jgi:uncharacterized protein
VGEFAPPGVWPSPCLTHPDGVECDGRFKTDSIPRLHWLEYLMSYEDELISSPLQQTLTVGGTSIEVHIYRMPDTGWTLEAVDEFGNSTVWEGEFDTDQSALDEVLKTIREEGIESLVGSPSEEASLSGDHASPTKIPLEIGSNPLRVMAPLSDEELDELDAFLMSDATSDETMSLEALDGYLTAIIVGPTTLGMSQWLHGVWGNSEEDAPAFVTIEQAQHIMELIMRHYNGIIWSLKHDPETHEPLFDVLTLESGSREYLDGEMWAYGFMQGLELCRRDWQPLFDDPHGPEWLQPIRLLGSDDISDEERAAIRWPDQREKLANQIPESVSAVYGYWLPYRQAVHEQQLAKTYQREHPKTGRNDPCPCGSGKKFKKCCGIAAILH